MAEAKESLPVTDRPEQILMTAAAFERVSERLGEADVVTVDGDGALARNGVAVDEGAIAPTLAWASLDAYPAGLLPRLFGLILAHDVAWCQLFNAGLDNPAFRALMAHGVRLTKSDAQAPAIAEYLLAHALARLHPIAEQRAAQDARDWRRVEFREVADTRWLLIGFGAIGRAVAERLRPFGAHLTVVRRTPGPDPLADVVIGPDRLLDHLPDADVIVLAAPLTAETEGLVDARLPSKPPSRTRCWSTSRAAGWWTRTRCVTRWTGRWAMRCWTCSTWNHCRPTIGRGTTPR